LCTILFVSLFATSLQAKTFRAGAAVADITPPLGETIVGSFAPFPADRVHDPLHARALVLDNEETTIAIVICDNLGIKKSVYDEARKLIAEQTRIPTANILMASTHTHSSTRADQPKYRPQVVAGIAAATKQAHENLRRARIAWGGVDEPSEVFNRRWYVSEPTLARNPFGGVDQVRMNPPRGNPALLKPAGPIDPEVSFLSVQSMDGDPIALLVALCRWCQQRGIVSRLFRHLCGPNRKSARITVADATVRRNDEQRHERRHQQYQLSRRKRTTL
jgi:hypothetical protein